MNRRAIPVFEISDYVLLEPDFSEFSIETIEHSILHRPNRSQPHTHPFFQVFLCQSACSLMHDFVDYAIEPPSLVFTSPGEVHSLFSTGGIAGAFISFTQAFFDGDTPPPSRLLDYPFFFTPGGCPHLRLGEEDRAACEAIFAELQREYDAAAPGAHEVIRAYLRILFTRSARLLAASATSTTSTQSGPGPLSRAAELVHHFRLAVENHFAGLHSLAEYAARLRVTPNHLNDMVRQETGLSAGQVIRNRQLLEAKRLLLHSSLSISEIGYRLQFKDPSYFSRFFRRMTGTSPARFRQEIREKYQRATL